jgi:hypothetical protein
MWNNYLDRKSSQFYKLMNNFKTMGRFRDKHFLMDMIQKGYVVMYSHYSEYRNKHITNESVYPAIADSIGKTIDTLDEVYPDMWDVTLKPCLDEQTGRETLNIYFTIFYEKVLIENGASPPTRQDIHELWVLLEPALNDNNVIYFQIPRGTRTKLQLSHAYSGYWHSHLNKRTLTNSGFNWLPNSFCTGESEIDEIQMEMSDLAQFDSGLFGLYLNMLKTVVSWESLSGVPYIKMKTIVTPSETPNKANYSKRDLELFFQDFRNYVSDGRLPDIDFVYSSERYIIKNNKKFEQYSREIIYGTNLESKLLVKRMEDGSYECKPDNILTSLAEDFMYAAKRKSPDGKIPYIDLRGKKYSFRIEKTKELTSNSEFNRDEYLIHPKFLEHAKSRLEQELYEKAVKRSVLQRRAESSYA